MKAFLYDILCLSVACFLAVTVEASSEFVNGSEIKVVTDANRAMEDKKEMVVFREGTAKGQPKAEEVKLKITNEFKPQPREEYKLSDPIYKWDGKEGALTDDGKEEEEATFTTTEKSWGKEFKIKGSIEYKDIPLDPKNKEELANQEGPAKADIKAVSPVVKVKSVTFRHGKENSSLPVAEDAKGKLIPTPEYQADGGDKETAILYASESTPVIQVCFDVKPANLKMEDVKIKGEVGEKKESILKSLTMEKSDNQNFDADSKIPFKAAKLEKKVAIGGITHEFEITYKNVQLINKPEYSVEKAYVVLKKPVGSWTKKTPWKKVLQFFIEECNTKGIDKDHDLICKMRSRLAQEKYPNDSKGSVLVHLKGKDVNLSNYLDGKTKSANCSDVATLLALGSGLHGISLEMHVCQPFLGDYYHSYNLFGGKVYDVRFAEGDGRFVEKDFYDQVGKGDKHIVVLQNAVLQTVEGFDPFYVGDGNSFIRPLSFDYIQKQTKKTADVSPREDMGDGKKYIAIGNNYFLLWSLDVQDLTLN